MYKLTFYFLVLVFSFVTLTSNNYLLAQTTSGSAGITNIVYDTFTLTITNKADKVSLGNPTNGLNIYVTPGGQGVAGILPGISFMASGATQILTDVKNNTISVAWDGTVSDGKVTLTGMLKQGQTVAPEFVINKIEKSGGVDITSDVTASVLLSSSIPQKQTEEDMSDEEEKDTTTAENPDENPDENVEEVDEPFLIITGPEEISVKEAGTSIIKLKIEGVDFTSIAKCTVDVSDDSFLRVKPRRFILSPKRLEKLMFAKISRRAIREISKNKSEEIESVDIDCSNDAFETFDILLTP